MKPDTALLLACHLYGDKSWLIKKKGMRHIGYTVHGLVGANTWMMLKTRNNKIEKQHAHWLGA